MGSIPKIVSTPLKWASKELLHRTLLRFPGGDAHDPVACTYCPEMCRFSCPTAVVSGNDAVTPCNKMSLLHKEKRWPGRAAGGGPLWPLYDCTGCGRCSDYCVYGVPVASQLEAARARYEWEPAQAAARALTDAEDPLGDLAAELGDAPAAARRLAAAVAVWGEPGISGEEMPGGRVPAPPFSRQSRENAGTRSVLCEEPKALHYAREHGVQASLSWDSALDEASVRDWRQRLEGRAWLLHESPWLSRRLGEADRVARWVDALRAAGARIERPFHHGKDCIDCGGEGAYARLFPEQARRMALDLWERDRHRAQGILCFSARCAAHLRTVLAPRAEDAAPVPVIAAAELPRRR